MDAAKLKQYAELIEAANQANIGKSKDIAFLAYHLPLRRAIADAKAGKITEPRGREFQGLNRWILDQSEIPRFSELSSALSAFELLLEDWPLPEDSPDFYGVSDTKKSTGIPLETAKISPVESSHNLLSIIRQILYRLLGKK